VTFRRSDENNRTTPGRRDKYGRKPGPGAGGSNEPLSGRRPFPPPALRPTRPDLTKLLGRTVLETRVQLACQQWGLTPYEGSGLSRSYLARDAGVELAADAHGVVTAIFLHFQDDDGFQPYPGPVPGTAATIERRTDLWTALGRPWESVDAFLGDYGPSDTWQLPHVVLNARYLPDGDRLHRITMTRPDRRHAG
jgi:hypothetical protein